MSLYKSNENVRLWLQGTISGTIKGNSYELLICIRKYVFDRADNKCEGKDCGCNKINPYSGKSILNLHHDDGDASNTRPENLKVLCPNCHAMTKTFGNIGGKRKSVRVAGHIRQPKK
jgi:5-methylcytosine-specific restriction endonuclease McrA